MSALTLIGNSRTIGLFIYCMVTGRGAAERSLASGGTMTGSTLAWAIVSLMS